MNYHLTNSREVVSLQSFTMYLLSDAAPKLDPAGDVLSAFQTVGSFLAVGALCALALFVIVLGVHTFLTHKAIH